MFDSDAPGVGVVAADDHVELRFRGGSSFVVVDDVGAADLRSHYPSERIEAFGVDEKSCVNAFELAVDEVGAAEDR